MTNDEDEDTLVLTPEERDKVLKKHKEQTNKDDSEKDSDDEN